MNIFEAGVQYNDFKGSVAADRSDTLRLLDYLREAGLAKESELLAGFRVVFGENNAREITNPGLVAYLYEEQEFVTRPKRIRAVDVDLPTSKLFAFLKRFDMVLMNKGMDFEDVPVDGPHYD